MNKNIVVLTVTVVILIGLYSIYMWLGNDKSTYFSQPISTDPSSQNFKQATVLIGGKKINVEIVDTPQASQKGLSGRASLPSGSGMLFVLATEHVPSFWMKDMNFSIDILWIDSQWNIIDIDHNVSPQTYPQTFSPSSPVKYVLEVNANWTSSNNVSSGQKVIFSAN